MQEWGPAVGAVLGAALGAVATVTVAVLGRRTGRETVQVQANVAEIEAGKLALSARQLAVQREEMVAEVTRTLGETYRIAFADLNTAYEHQGTRLTHLEQEVVPELRAALAACLARERAQEPLHAARDARIARLVREVQRLGGHVDD